MSAFFQALQLHAIKIHKTTHRAEHDRTGNHGNTHQVDITQVVQPEVVAGRRRDRELVVTERAVTERDGLGETTQNPQVQ